MLAGARRRQDRLDHPLVRVPPGAAVLVARPERLGVRDAIQHRVLAQRIADEVEDLVGAFELCPGLRRQLCGTDAGADDDERSGHMAGQTITSGFAYEPWIARMCSSISFRLPFAHEVARLS